MSKELNHLVANLHVYAKVWFFEVKIIIIIQKEKGNTFYIFNHFYSEKSSKRSKYVAQIYHHKPQSAGIYTCNHPKVNQFLGD